MLAITRSVGEKVFIGPDIMLVVTKVENGRVTIAIAAPQTTKILRGELAGVASR